jgi:predicted O-methyltransferase YrrM
MPDLEYEILEPQIQRGLVGYVRERFAPEDEVLRAVREQARSAGLPEIQIHPEDGRILQFLVTLVGARRILEIGTLAGYSGIWLARALPPGGRLTTLEFEPERAEIARQHFALAGLADRVEVIPGDARRTLAAMNGIAPFDMVFIDADKESYPIYLDWAIGHVRPGGLIAGHNAFRRGELISQQPDEKVIGTRQMLETMATHPRLFSTIIPVGDGLAVSIVKG